MNIITDFMPVFRHNFMQIPLKTNGCSVLKYIVLNFSTLRAIFLTPGKNLKRRFFNVVWVLSGSISHYQNFLIRCYVSIYTYLLFFILFGESRVLRFPVLVAFIFSSIAFSHISWWCLPCFLKIYFNSEICLVFFFLSYFERNLPNADLFLTIFLSEFQAYGVIIIHIICP